MIQKKNGQKKVLKDIKNIYDYMYRLGELKPGESINIKVRRGERIIDLTVNL